jgi:hypothetical protein
MRWKVRTCNDGKDLVVFEGVGSSGDRNFPTPLFSGASYAQTTSPHLLRSAQRHKYAAKTGQIAESIAAAATCSCAPSLDTSCRSLLM